MFSTLKDYLLIFLALVREPTFPTCQFSSLTAVRHLSFPFPVLLPLGTRDSFLSETLLKPQWNTKHPTWLQEAENQQIHNQAFAFDITELLQCAPLCGLGQAAAPCIAPEITPCQKHSMHCCITSSANTAEDHRTFTRISSNFPKRRAHLPWCTFSH